MQGFKPVARQSRQVLKRCCAVQQRQPARRLGSEALKCRDPLTFEEAPCPAVPEAADHGCEHNRCYVTRKGMRPTVDTALPQPPHGSRPLRGRMILLRGRNAN